MDGGSWHVDQRPFVGHTRSVEDLQWSPTEDTVRKGWGPGLRGLGRKEGAGKGASLKEREAHRWSPVSVVERGSTRVSPALPCPGVCLLLS